MDDFDRRPGRRAPAPPPPAVVAYRSAEFVLRVARGRAFALQDFGDLGPNRADAWLLGELLAPACVSWIRLLKHLAPDVLQAARTAPSTGRERHAPSNIELVAVGVGLRLFTGTPWRTAWTRYAPKPMSRRRAETPQEQARRKLWYDVTAEPGKLDELRQAVAAMGWRNDETLLAHLHMSWTQHVRKTGPHSAVEHDGLSARLYTRWLKQLRIERRHVMQHLFGDPDRFAADCEREALDLANWWLTYRTQLNRAIERTSAAIRSCAEGVKCIDVRRPCARELAAAAAVHRSTIYRLCKSTRVGGSRGALRGKQFSPAEVRLLLNAAESEGMRAHARMKEAWARWME